MDCLLVLLFPVLRIWISLSLVLLIVGVFALFLFVICYYYVYRFDVFGVIVSDFDCDLPC